MGNSRVIFVGAVSIIMGLYSVGLQKVERAVNNIGTMHACQMQAEEIANSGITLAVFAMGISKPTPLPSLNARSAFQGVVSYIVDDNGLAVNEARITSQGTYKGHQVTRVAIIKLTSGSSTTQKKRWSNWEVVKAYSQFSAEEYDYQEGN